MIVYAQMSVLRGRKDVEDEDVDVDVVKAKRNIKYIKTQRKNTKRKKIKNRKHSATKHSQKEKKPPHYKLNYNDLRDQERRRSEEGRIS